MSLIAVDVGGTKIAGALFSRSGQIIDKSIDPVREKKGEEIGEIICERINSLARRADQSDSAKAIGVSIPGIYDAVKDSVWAPNLPGWQAYPLHKRIKQSLTKDIPVFIESDRSCYILGEVWMGNAKGCKDAIFLAVGTGIGAGILTEGRILHGAGNIAGAVGWMGLSKPYFDEYGKYGCFEYHASGEGLVRVARKYLSEKNGKSELRKIGPNELNTRDVFEAYEKEDPAARRIIREAVEFWGMAAANLISIFNPEKILFGGGVFDTAAPLLDEIRRETKKWAQPIAMEQVSIELAGLGNEAGLFGAAYLALTSIESSN